MQVKQTCIVLANNQWLSQFFGIHRTIFGFKSVFGHCIVWPVTHADPSFHRFVIPSMVMEESTIELGCLPIHCH